MWRYDKGNYIKVCARWWNQMNLSLFISSAISIPQKPHGSKHMIGYWDSSSQVIDKGLQISLFKKSIELNKLGGSEKYVNFTSTLTPKTGMPILVIVKRAC